MRNTNLNPWRFPPNALRSRGLAALLTLLGLVLISPADLRAQATVTTLGGGALKSPYAGYIDGNTLFAAKFAKPAGLAVDPSGTVLYVADYTNNAIRKVSQVGNTNGVTATFASSANSINRPLAVVVDASTNVYVLNRGSGANGTLLRFAGAGGTAASQTTLATSLINATALAVDSSNNCFVTVSGNKVIRIATNGVQTTVGTVTTAGTSLQGIALLPNGQIALSDGANNGILLMSNGISSVLTGFHGAGDVLGAKSVAAFKTPESISADGNGTLVVADYGNNKVKLVDGSGNVTLLYGVSSNLWISGAGNFPGWRDGGSATTNGSAESRLPYGVVVSYDASVIVSEDFYHVLRQVTGTGLSAPSVPGSGSSGSGGSGGGGSGPAGTFSGPAGIAYDNLDGLLLVANANNGTVQILDPVALTNGTMNFLSGADGLSTPVAVLLDTNDNVYVLNRGSGNILKFDLNGNPYGPIVTGLNQPTAFTIDGFGNIFVTEQAGKIRGFGSGVPSTVATVTNANVSLQGIALFDDGSMAVSDAGNQVLWSVNPITKQVAKLTGKLGISGAAVGSTNFAQFNQPRQLTRVGGNQLVGADYGNNRLVLIQRNGTISTNFNTLNAEVWFGGSGGPVRTNSTQFVNINSPVGVAIGGGQIFDSEALHSDIRGISSTLTSPSADPGVPLPTYANPAGIAVNVEGTALLVANRTNNAITVLNVVNNQTSIFLDSANGINQPVDVLLDNSDNVFVLNRGDANNGSILEFDRFGNPFATVATGLPLPSAMTLDSSGNVLVAELTGMVQQFNLGSGTSNTIAIVTNAGVQLQGIALFNDGTIVVSDSASHVLWQIDAVSRAVSRFTGQLNSPGTTFGSSAFAKLNQPHQLKLAAGSLLVTADTGNNRVVTVDRSGSITNVLNSTNASVWFGLPNDPAASGSPNFVSMTSPVGVAIGTAGAVFASETYYNDIREMLGTSLGQPGLGGGGGSTTNIVVTPPIISPNAGYYPMGQTILVQSPVSQVYYTTDGSDPTTNSHAVSMSGNLGFIRWFNSTNDLSGLRIRAFINGTNSSLIVSGQSVPTANIGVPPDFNPTLQAGIGSTIVIPVVCNLSTNEQVQSYQFRFEIAPANSPNTPAILPLSISPTNDFVPLVTSAQTGFTATYSYQPYSLGVTNGLTIFAVGAGTHTLFQRFAVVALLEVQIPYTANAGDTYNVNILYPSATSDAYNTPVALATMPSVTITVTNIPYTVGDSASAIGAWYDAGTFGDNNLDNSDVNQAFYAASGLRVPYPFTDVFNAMDAYPPDANGFVGGDGQLRFLDWATILQRSLRLDLNDWSREWSAGGSLINFTTNLAVPHVLLAPAAQAGTKIAHPWPWYRQVLLGADSVGNALPGSTVSVPVYAKLADGASLAGLQFRAVVAPLDGAPASTTAPQLVTAFGVSSPDRAQSFKAGEAAFGWSLGSFSYSSRSSNFLGTVSIAIPSNAVAGQSYQVSLLNADGAPDLTNQYDFETRTATITVGADAPAATICSDEWKAHFFGSTTNAAAADNADPDGDGVPNWIEFLAGTDPTDAQSKLQLACNGIASAKGQSQMQLNWLTAPGHAYALQSSSSLSGGAWQTLATISGNGSVTNYPDLTPSSAARYYRLYVLP